MQEKNVLLLVMFMLYRNCFSQHFIVYSVELCPEKFLIIITVEIAISSSM